MSPDGGPVQPGDEEMFPAAALHLVPPPELADAIRAAADACDRLEASGRRLRFALDPQNGRLAIHVLDARELMIGELTASEVLVVAETGRV
jgi:hypothetical protein